MIENKTYSYLYEAKFDINCINALCLFSAYYECVDIYSYEYNVMFCSTQDCRLCVSLDVANLSFTDNLTSNKK